MTSGSSTGPAADQQHYFRIGGVAARSPLRLVGEMLDFATTSAKKSMNT